MCVWVYSLTCVCLRRPEEGFRFSGARVVSCLTWVLGAKLVSSVGAAGTFAKPSLLPQQKGKKRKKKNHSLPSLDFKKIWKRNPLAISLGVGYLFLAVSAASILWWEECKVKPSDSSRWNEMSRGPVSWRFSEAGEFKSSGKDSLIVPQWQPWQTILKIQMATA